MDIAVLGSGNVAAQMSRALRMAGHRITAVWSRNAVHAEVLASEMGAGCVSIADGVPAADVYLVSVSDDAVSGVVNMLGRLPQGALLLHTAGSVPMYVLGGAGCAYGVMYPLQTLSSARRIDFSAVPLFIEASDDASLDRLRELAVSISQSVTVMDSPTRCRLHLAATIACNFTNHCFELARREMSKCGLDFSLLMPLIEETVSKVRTMSPETAQTGPAVRNDATVMARHEAMIDSPLTREIYMLMSQSINPAVKTFDKHQTNSRHGID